MTLMSLFQTWNLRDSKPVDADADMLRAHWQPGITETELIRLLLLNAKRSVLTQREISCNILAQDSLIHVAKSNALLGHMVH